MIDVATKKPLKVEGIGSRWPYITVSVDQLGALRQLLVSANIPYDVDEDVVSLNGGPEIGVLNVGRTADLQAVQALLNSLP